jgi:hypothetical protein
MTRDSDFKKLVRQRMAATGQSYTAARAAIYRPATDVDLPLTRRVFGLKTSYTVAFDGGQAPGGVGAGEYLFRWMVAWGRSANVFLENGARFHLRLDESDVAQPAYATPECDSIVELVAAERAGDEILVRLAVRAEESLTSEGSPAALAVSRVEAAQSESYLVASAVAPERYLRRLEPFLATRWIYGGVVRCRPPRRPCRRRRSPMRAATGDSREVHLVIRLGGITSIAYRKGAPLQRGVRTSNSLPSGSARHVHGTSPWPRSMSVAPSARSRATSAA